MSPSRRTRHPRGAAAPAACLTTIGRAPRSTRADEALRLPKLFNLRTDPFERADVTSNTYYDWVIDNAYIVLAASALVGQFLATFEEFPPRQHAASFTIDQAVAKLEASLTAGQ